MKAQNSLSLILSGIYIIVCIYFFATQGLFGESFIALILGMPWSLGLAYFEFFNAEGTLAYILVLAPIVLNAGILYWIGSLLKRS